MFSFKVCCKTYKELGKELEDSNELAVANFLTVNPKAIIRPLVVRNNELIIGFKAEGSLVKPHNSPPF
ncbi:arsenate reductase family protein [Desulfosporosinus shakirovi]|uniref:arsenate reductase family protein n=1 Tax=Desulfosporosinus shakirovi TaxID=2885154 RepID=UPI0037BE5BF3|nr:hypothetical protein [Desulfosporosinus sp. SRJS8]